MSRFSQQGFALIDVVVGLAIAGLVTLLAEAGLRQFVDARDRASAARNESLQGVAVRRQLVDWLSAAVVTGRADGADFEGSPGMAETGEADDRVTFITAAPGPFTIGFQPLLLYVDRDPATPEVGLVAGRSGENLVQIEPRATGLVARYLHRIEGEYAWTGEWASSLELPLAVEVRVLGDSIAPLLRVPVFAIPRAAS